MNKKIFISTPISGFEDRTGYKKFRLFILNLIDCLRRKGFDVCSEIEQISNSEDYDSPSKSVEDDFSNINNSDFFLMIHPCRMQTSSLIELGYACANSKKIVIVGNKNTLPYLAKGLEKSNIQTYILDISEIDNGIIPQISNTVLNFNILKRDDVGTIPL